LNQPCAFPFASAISKLVNGAAVLGPTSTSSKQFTLGELHPSTPFQTQQTPEEAPAALVCSGVASAKVALELAGIRWSNRFA
jgi:hypothetical protein